MPGKRKHKKQAPVAGLSAAEVRKTLHELQVHQVELEAQNEELFRTQTELEALRSRYFDLYDLAPVGYFTLNGDGRVMETNLTSADLLGMPKSALIKHALTRFIHPDDQDIFYRHRRELLKTGEPQACELRMMKADGALIWVRLEAAVVKGAGAGKDTTRAVIMDITGRRLADERLQASENRYRALFESSRDALMTLEPPSWAFTSGNPATVNIFGVRDEKEFVSCTPADLSPEKQPDGRASGEKAGEMIETAMREGSHYFEWTHRRRMGELFPATVLLARVEYEGKKFLQATVRDLSEQKRAEEEKGALESRLRQSEKMESIGQLAGGVAHDFNNLLFNIVGACEMIKKESRDEAALFYAHQISEAALKGGSLTRQLLAFARKGQYVMAQTDVRKSAGNVIDILEHSIDKRISVELKAGPVPVPVRTDAGQLENAILNLAINARDAMPKGGRLLIEVNKSVLDEEYCRQQSDECLSGEFAEITVSDSGVGMDKETKARIFEPFFTTKDVGKGTGLGLSSVYGFVKQMGGFVQVQSEEGRGSVFRMYLPISKEQAPEAIEEESAAVKGSGHILLVEDEPGIRNLGLRILKGLEYQATACADGEEAVKYFRANSDKVDLVILDLIMPKLGGYDCFMEMLRINPSIPVIISSGFGIDTEVQEMLDSGAKGFIQKPYRIEALSKLIAEKIRKR